MKIHRLRVEALRRFREPYELAELSPGLNVFTGDNEAGKSTLVRAIRAACFERHRSTSVEDLRPTGDSAAAPRIELDFELGGTEYRLVKSFLQKKRCELSFGTRQLDGAAAEDHLAQLLGFEFAAKGASRDEHWGIPGLLWIEQGRAQEVREAVRHAAVHLRQALQASLGEIAATGGDALLDEVRRLREELLTPNGRPRAALLGAQDDLAQQSAEEARLQQALAAYRSQVDALRTLREAHRADQREQPWSTWRAQQIRAREALDAAQALEGERQREAERRGQTEGLLKLLDKQAADAAAQQQALQGREAALTTAQSAHDQARARQAAATEAEARAVQRHRAALQALAQARQEDTRAHLARQATDARRRAAEQAAQCTRAQAQAERAEALHRAAAQAALPAAELAALRRHGARLAEGRIRQAAVATRLRYRLQPGAALQLDGTPLQGEGEHLLVAPATLQLPGLGELEIRPGGDDLAALAREQAAEQAALQALLQRLGLASADEAEARAREQARLQAEAAAARDALALLAPQGVEALQRSRHEAEAQQAEAEAALARLPVAPPADTPTPPLAEALATEAAESAQAQAASQSLQQAQQALAAAASALQAAQREHEALRTLLHSPERQTEQAAREAEQAALRLRLAGHDATLQALLARWQAARPDILAQDVQRFGRSADEAERAHQARERQIVQLEATLAAAGAQGLEEELALCSARARQAERRLAQLSRRAEALSYLLARLDERRQAVTRALQAPLQRHLDHYLDLLFPGGRLAVDDDGVPGHLTRPGAPGGDTAVFDTLSFGAREQMGVLSRLAYADLLRASGRPTLLILDDALVHTDATRLAQMKRALFDASQRHQVLVFTCHGAQWRDLGVPLRAL